MKVSGHMKIYKFFAAFTVLLCAGRYSAAGATFSGFAGIKGAFLSTEDTAAADNQPETGAESDGDIDDFDPQLMVQAFFAGQFILSENIIFHTEFSVSTSNLIENSIFKGNSSTFTLDELSLVFRKQFPGAANYLSLFAGTYEPIGSDIFLRRQFGIQPIASKMTESWLGLSGSVIYPQFGIGAADTVHFMAQPIAAGLYVYVNKELADKNDEECWGLNADARLACVYRFFTFDAAAGAGFPFEKTDTDNYIFAVRSIYGRAGVNLLLGNNYTSSLFVQAGISNVQFTKMDGFSPDSDKAYFLFEPRFRAKKFRLHITAFSLPADTAAKFLFINDTLGLNFLVYTDDLYLKNKSFSFGINGALTFPGKNFSDLNRDILDKFNVTAAPYFSTRFYNGQINTMLQAKIRYADKSLHPLFKLHIGYKTQF